MCFQDRRYAPGNALIFTTCASSSDAGRTFRNQQVTTQPFDASNNTFIGDYNWQASTRTSVMAIFAGDAFAGADANGQEIFVATVKP